MSRDPSVSVSGSLPAVSPRTTSSELDDDEQHGMTYLVLPIYTDILVLDCAQLVHHGGLSRHLLEIVALEQHGIQGGHDRYVLVMY